MITKPRYAVMGYPVAHSRSPALHQAFAKQVGLDLHYEAIDVAPGQLTTAIKQFFAEGGCGLNITVPHKEQAFLLTHTHSARAEQARAVNTIARQADGALYGDNTDGEGLLADLDAKQVIVSKKRVLVLGSGGAAQGILGPLLVRQPAQLAVVSRARAKAVALAAHFQRWGVVEGLDYEALRDKSEWDLVINATSCGLQGLIPPVPPDCLRDAVAYDLAYGDAAKSFLDFAAQHDARHRYDGWGMLVAQAAASFFLWTGRKVDPLRCLDIA